jgi:hypothetical protein
VPQRNTAEYIVIGVVEGDVHFITPSSPQTETVLHASAQSLKVEIGFALNKMAEHGYRLTCPAPIALGEVHPARANYIVFMERKN